MVDVLTRLRVSIICLGKDQVAAARACIETLAHRGLDGEVIHDLGLLKALRASRGEFIALWPAHGRLDPGALSLAMDEFAQHPHAGAVCGQGFLVDGDGAPITRADIVTLLFTSCRPFLSAGVFRRQALVACGLDAEGWQDGS